MNERNLSLLNFCKQNTIYWVTEISFTVTAQPNLGGNKCSITNNDGYTPNLKLTFTPSAL